MEKRIFLNGKDILIFSFSSPSLFHFHFNRKMNNVLKKSPNHNTLALLLKKAKMLIFQKNWLTIMLKSSSATHDKSYLSNTKTSIYQNQSERHLSPLKVTSRRVTFKPNCIFSLLVGTANSDPQITTSWWLPALAGEEGAGKGHAQPDPSIRYAAEGFEIMLYLRQGSSGWCWEVEGTRLAPNSSLKEDRPRTGRKMTCSRNPGTQSPRAFSPFLQVWLRFRLEHHWKSTAAKLQQPALRTCLLP